VLKNINCKSGGSYEKWTRNSLNFNVNFPNLIHICGYKLSISEQNLAQKGLSLAKILLLFFFFFGGGGSFFDSPCAFNPVSTGMGDRPSSGGCTTSVNNQAKFSSSSHP